MKYLSFVLRAKGYHGMILSKGESGSNLHVRRIIFVKDLLVLSKKLKQNTKKVIQRSSAYARIGSAAGPHKNGSWISIKALSVSVFFTFPTRYLVSSFYFIVFFSTGFSVSLDCKAKPQPLSFSPNSTSPGESLIDSLNQSSPLSLISPWPGEHIAETMASEPAPLIIKGVQWVVGWVNFWELISFRRWVWHQSEELRAGD